MKPHFLAKLNEGIGPSPATELRSILEQARRSPDRTAWFPTRTAGREWENASDSGTSIALVFHTYTIDKSVEVVAAKVLERRDQIPDDQTVKELFAGHERFQAWWRVAEPFGARLPALNAIPGTSREGKTAEQAFVGQLAFAYWQFDDVDRVYQLFRAGGRSIARHEDLALIGGLPRVSASWESSSAEQRADSIRRWAAIERPHSPPLADEAFIRENIYD